MAPTPAETRTCHLSIDLYHAKDVARLRAAQEKLEEADRVARERRAPQLELERRARENEGERLRSGWGAHVRRVKVAEMGQRSKVTETLPKVKVDESEKKPKKETKKEPKRGPRRAKGWVDVSESDGEYAPAPPPMKKHVVSGPAKSYEVLQREYGALRWSTRNR